MTFPRRLLPVCYVASGTDAAVLGTLVECPGIGLGSAVVTGGLGSAVVAGGLGSAVVAGVTVGRTGGRLETGW